MKYLIISIVILIQFVYAADKNCNIHVSGYQNRENGVAVQFSGGLSTIYATDDDGYLLTLLAAAHCRSMHPQILKPTAGQTQDRAKKKLTCANDIKDLVNKAIVQNSLYVENQTTDANLATLKIGNIDATEKEKLQYKARLRTENAYIRELGNILNSPAATVGEFDRWVNKLEDPVHNHGYYVEATDENGELLKDYTFLKNILLFSNTDFLITRKDGTVDPCFKPFDTALINKFREISWRNAYTSAADIVAPALLGPRSGK